MKSLDYKGVVCPDKVIDKELMQKYLKLAFNNLYGEKIDISMIKEDFINDMQRAIRAVLVEYKKDLKRFNKAL